MVDAEVLSFEVSEDVGPVVGSEVGTIVGD